MKRRAVREHTNSAVRRASKVVGRGTGTPEEIEAARAVLSNYRLAHAFPLNAVTVTVRKRALAVDPNAIVAQRHKRMPTILDKLERHPLDERDQDAGPRGLPRGVRNRRRGR